METRSRHDTKEMLCPAASALRLVPTAKAVLPTPGGPPSKTLTPSSRNFQEAVGNVTKRGVTPTERKYLIELASDFVEVLSRSVIFLREPAKRDL